MKLDKILDVPKWQTLQDALANATGLAIITVDYKGVPVTEHSCRSPYCDYVRQHSELNGFCQKCDSRGGLEAVRIGQPYTYLCHCRIVDIAIPIIIDDRYVGALMAGQIRLSDEDEENKLEVILHSPNNPSFNTHALKSLYKKVPQMPLEQLQVSVKMLSELCNYTVEEAMNKNVVLEMYERAIDQSMSGIIPEGHSVSAVENLRRDITDAVTSKYIKRDDHTRTTPQNKSLEGAFKYIYENKGEMVSQKKAADLCHLSSGHFSRLFVKEVGDHYSHYYSRLKTEWAKQLLDNTDLSISHISEELGFNEPGYFIKTFRRYEGITPAAYKKHI